MTIRNTEEAAQAAEHTLTNHVGWCQLVTRGYYLAPSVGDFDGDGQSDAEDGAKSEPLKYRHTDKRGRRGLPASFFGGSNDNGHRAIFVRPFILRSTDFDSVTKRYRAGVVGEGTVDEVAAAMGVQWGFYSDTIDGILIPKPKPLTRGWRVEKAEKLIHNAKSKPGTPRHKALMKILKLLKAVPK